MRKVFIVMLVLIAMVTGMAFASGAPEQGSSSNEPITLRFMWWGGTARHEATLKIIDLYMQRNPNIKIEAEYDGGAMTTQQKLFTQLASGNAADVVQVDAWWTDAQTKFNAFEDLTKYPQIDMSGFDMQFVKDYGSMNGVIYALPTGINAPLMLINRDVLDAAGIEWRDQWTWEDILVEGPKVNKNNPNQYFLNVDPYTGSYYIMRTYLSQLSGNPTTLDETYELGFTEEQMKTVAEYIRKCYELKIMQPAEEAMPYRSRSQENPLWINGNAAVSLNWTSMLNTYKGELKNLDVATIPIMASGAKNSGMFSRPSQLLAITANSKHKEAAADFINFFYNDPEAIEILKDCRSVPPTEKARQICNEKGLMDPLIVKATDNAMSKVNVVDSVLAQDVVLLDALWDEFEAIAYGKDPSESAKSFVKLMTDRLEELKNN